MDCFQRLNNYNMKKFLILFSTVALMISCQKSQKKSIKENEPKLKMLVTKYYSIKMENDRVVRDTVKECFSCNQAIVYDQSGKEIALRFYKRNMTDFYGYEEYEYDTLGRKIGSQYYENDTLRTEYRYALDSLGRIATSKAFDVKTDKMLYGTAYKYDQKGNQYESGSMTAKGEIVEFYRRTYNNQGIPIAENIEDLNGDPTFKVKYEYRPKADSTWLEQLTYYNDKLTEIRFKDRIFFEQ